MSTSTKNHHTNYLRQRMQLTDMRIRNLADNTQSAYLQQVIAYAKYFHRSRMNWTWKRFVPIRFI